MGQPNRQNPNTVLLRTELNLLPMHYLVCLRRLRYALSFFRCPFFTDFLAPLLDSGPLDAGAGGARYRALQVGVLPLLTAAIDEVAGMGDPEQPVSLASVRADAASDLGSTAWANRTKGLVRQHFASTWPAIGVGDSGPLPDTVDLHLRMVCRHPPGGTPSYIRLGGALASIGLHFKGFSLRCSGFEGLPHHTRCACLQCGEPNAECGIHLLECTGRPAGRVDRLLSRIMLQEEREPSTAAAINSYIWTDDRRARALVFARRLHWPHMTRPGTQAVLREIGLLLNQYRKAWSGPPGVANPIFEVVLPPLS